jgi:hypothetical protein
MTRFHHKFGLVPKLSLRKELEEIYINKKYKVLTSDSCQRELYLNVFYIFCCVSNSLQALIEDVLIS